MKILEQGKAWSKKVTCRGCKSLLEIEEGDLQYEVTVEDSTRDQYKEEVQGTFYIMCPVDFCGQRLDIKAKDVATKVAEKVKNK